MSSSNKLGKLKLRRILSSLKSMCFLRGRLDDFSTVIFPIAGEEEKLKSLEGGTYDKNIAHSRLNLVPPFRFNPVYVSKAAKFDLIKREVALRWSIDKLFETLSISIPTSRQLDISSSIVSARDLWLTVACVLCVPFIFKCKSILMKKLVDHQCASPCVSRNLFENFNIQT